MPDDLPVLGVCGFSNSGKTTLIEQTVGGLLDAGLNVCVLKNNVHGIDVDHPGKDSDRFFRAGADVMLQEPAEVFGRRHAAADKTFDARLAELAGRYDLVIVEGHKSSGVAKVWLLAKDELAPPPDVTNVLAVLPPGDGRSKAFGAIVRDFLADRWLRTPVYGCVLIGGGSSRMGTPKHLLPSGGQTWLEQTVRRLAAVADRVVVSGAGEVPASLTDVTRLPDVPDARGPLGGILSAMRWAPRAGWLVAACDLPDITDNALRWLLGTRRPGAWATLPKLPGESRVEPLLAHYDPRAVHLLEARAAAGRADLQGLTASEKVFTPDVPGPLVNCWRNVNAPQDL